MNRPTKRTEGVELDGIYYPPNACATCGRWLPPWKAGVPACDADLYCWGRHADGVA